MKKQMAPLEGEAELKDDYSNLTFSCLEYFTS